MTTALSVLGILIVSFVLGLLFDWRWLFLAIPLLLIYFGGLMGNEARQRQKRIMRLKRFRRDVRAKKFEFDEDDRKTIAV